MVGTCMYICMLPQYELLTCAWLSLRHFLADRAGDPWEYSCLHQHDLQDKQECPHMDFENITKSKWKLYKFVHMYVHAYHASIMHTCIHLWLTYAHVHTCTTCIHITNSAVPNSSCRDIHVQVFICTCTLWCCVFLTLGTHAQLGRSVCLSVCLSLSVCQSVCRRFNSLLDGLFVPQTIPPTQRVTRISLIEGFFLKRLRCRDQHLPLLYGLLRSAILCAEITRMR